jgi:hypothetical protein
MIVKIGSKQGLLAYLIVPSELTCDTGMIVKIGSKQGLLAYLIVSSELTCDTGIIVKNRHCEHSG